MSDDQIRQLKYEQAYESALSQPAEAEEPARADEVVFDTLLVVNNQLRTENKRLRTQLAEAGKAIKSVQDQIHDQRMRMLGDDSVSCAYAAELWVNQSMLKAALDNLPKPEGTA